MEGRESSFEEEELITLESIEGSSGADSSLPKVEIEVRKLEGGKSF